MPGVETQEATASEYLRVSFDRSGQQRSNTEQQDDNRDTWPFRFQSTYRDTGSASRYSTRKRGDFDTLTTDLETGRFGADMLVMWESSRGSRRVAEWVQLIDLCEQHHVRIAVTTHHRIYDPANPRDRRSLIDDANDSEYESAKISERTRRSAARAAAAGRPSGRITFGYRSVYDQATGRLEGRVPNPDEAHIVVELFERIARGDTFRAIATDFETRGMLRRTGLPFTNQHLRSMALCEAYRAKRIHIPGRRSGVVRRAGDGVTVYDAEWEPLVPERLWLQVNAILHDKGRHTVRPGRAKHLLSFLSFCDVCDSPMTAAYRKSVRCYECRLRHCVRLAADALDAYARGVVLAWLLAPGRLEALTAFDGDDESLEAARLAVTKIKAERDDLGDRLGRNEVTAGLAARAEPAILARLAAAEATVTGLTTPPALRGLLGPGEDVTLNWDSAPVATRREVLRALFVPTRIGVMRIARCPTPGRSAPPEDRVVWQVDEP